MNDIEVGEYIRTKNGIIKRITDIYTKMIIVGHGMQDIGYFCKFDEGNSIFAETFEKLQIELKKYISKHSKNLIDLIENGDYVNGHEVITVYGYDENGNDKDELGICEVDGDDAYYYYLEKEDIKSIVTKEQFSNIEYKI